MNDEPRLSAEQMIERLSGALSPWRRLRGVAALVAGLAGAVFVVLLWATEPGPLPGRTQLAFAMFTLFCLAWAGYGSWAITRRAALFALDRVIAAWLALAASIATTALTMTLAAQRGSGLLPAVGVGVVFIAVAAVLAVRAHAGRAALLRRKRELTG
ncbi:hypothetical protein ACGFNP_20860 [Nonomuraea sp. NPDC049269]|uniref:hypothetical protein n=1 Tax=Nonomuraea sp. NPDC049269 TaxID=3364349 RepID=UPI003715A85C